MAGVVCWCLQPTADKQCLYMYLHTTKSLGHCGKFSKMGGNGGGGVQMMKNHHLNNPSQVSLCIEAHNNAFFKCVASRNN